MSSKETKDSFSCSLEPNALGLLLSDEVRILGVSGK
jgi:hypothetical protein